MKRCPNGTRRNKKSGECVAFAKKTTHKTATIKKKRCPNGSRRNKKTGDCDALSVTNALPGGQDLKPKTLKDYFTVRVIGKGKKAGHLKIR